MPEPKQEANKNVAQQLVNYLHLQDVTHVFGVPGGALMNVLNAFKNSRQEIQFVVCRQETGAAYIADGYARERDGLGVVMVTSGPGATNALTGVMNADNDGSPLLLITGEIARQFFGKGYLQEGVDARLDIGRIYAASCGYSTLLADASDSETLIQQALRTALVPPHRAVHIGIPNDVAAATLNTSLPNSSAAFLPKFAAVGAPAAREVLETISGCKRPAILLGNGCRRALRGNALQTFTALVERYAIPVLTTADGKGIFPESHPLSLRVYGIADCMWPQYWMCPERLDKAAPAYDGLLVLGSSLGELSTNKWDPMLQPDGPLIQVDLDADVIGRGFPTTQGIVAEVGSFMQQLAAASEQVEPCAESVSARTHFVEKIKASHSPFFDQEGYQSNSQPIHPASIMRVLQEALPAASSIYIDAGNCVGWSVHYLQISPPRSIYTSLAMGPMGFAVAAVVGAKIAKPQRCCIAIVGDGAFMMQGSEISTAQAHGVGAIWLVLADNDLSMVSQGMSHFLPDSEHPGIWSELYHLGEPNLVLYAQGLGADAYEINSPGALTEVMPTVLKGSDEGRPQVIVAQIDRAAIPPYYNADYVTHAQ